VLKTTKKCIPVKGAASSPVSVAFTTKIGHVRWPVSLLKGEILNISRTYTDRYNISALNYSVLVRGHLLQFFATAHGRQMTCTERPVSFEKVGPALKMHVSGVVVRHFHSVCQHANMCEQWVQNNIFLPYFSRN